MEYEDLKHLILKGGVFKINQDTNTKTIKLIISLDSKDGEKQDFTKIVSEKSLDLFLSQ